MHVDLSDRDFEILVESLTYSQRAVDEGTAPPESRRAKVAEIVLLIEKLREGRKLLASSGR